METRGEAEVRETGFKKVIYTSKERNELLEETPWSKTFGARQIETLADYMRAYTAKKGCFIFEEDDAESFMCMIIRGSVDIISSTGGSSRVVANLQRGQSFGEMSLVDGRPRSATAMPATDSLFLVLSKDHFEHLIDEHAGLGVRFLLRLSRLISERLRRTNTLLEESMAARRDRLPAEPLRGLLPHAFVTEPEA